MDLDGLRDSILYTGGAPRAIDFDHRHVLSLLYAVMMYHGNTVCRRSNMYWTDDTYNRIYKSNLDGSSATVILSTDLMCPGILALVDNTITSSVIYRWHSMGLD